MSNIIPVVSACIITYNQEEYIEAAIEGALLQELDYPYEIVIGDDCSTDGTLEICKKYAKQYPGKIRLLERGKNLGMNGNWINSIEACHGEYIALCEGDDYWIRPDKLQSQVYFLMNNASYSLCSHEIYLKSLVHDKRLQSAIGILYDQLKYGDLIQFSQVLSLLMKRDELFWEKRRAYRNSKRIYESEFKDIINHIFKDRFIHTSSMVLRSHIFQKIPDEIWNYTIGHRLVILWFALFGKIKHFKTPMTVRTIQPSSSAVTKRVKHQTSEMEKIFNKKKMLEMIKEFAGPHDRLILENYLENADYN